MEGEPKHTREQITGPEIVDYLNKKEAAEGPNTDKPLLPVMKDIIEETRRRREEGSTKPTSDS